MFDPDLYRDPAEVEAWKQRDPISRYGERLVAQDELAANAVEELWEAARGETERAVAFAEAAELEPVEHLTCHVMAAPGPTASTDANNARGGSADGD
jgi:pyruvate dehydrogenase E1 component alpha subunit